MSNRSILITPTQLQPMLNDPAVVVVDGSWHLPNANRYAQLEYEAGHIHGAHFFDIDEIADKASGLPHTLPSNEQFAKAVGEMGISNDTPIVVYDAAGMFSAARVWWMLKSYGATNIRVLDGGLPAWQGAGFEVTSEKSATRKTKFVAQLSDTKTVSLSQMRDHVDAGDRQILDARGAGRFGGQEAEPRPGMQAGHMPGAINIPFPTLLNKDGTFRSTEELKTHFAGSSVKLDGPIITTCGSGVTASIILLALALIGKNDAQLFDGSWAQWGSLLDTPIEKY